MRRVWRDRRGAVSLIVAASSALLLGLAALAVDLGSVFLQTRKLQGMADLAALSAAADLSRAQAAADATVAANGWRHPVTTVTETGAYAADRAIAPDARFTVGGATRDAVRVTLRSQADLFFGAAILRRETTPISRSAIAASTDMAALSIGSRVAALDGGVANRLLSALAGSTVSLSVMDYDALVEADVELLQFASALRTDADLDVGSFAEVLSTDVTAGQVLDILAEVLDDGGRDRAASAVRKVARVADRATPAPLSDLIDLGPYGAQDRTSTGASLDVSAMDLTNAVLLLAKEGRQVKLDLGADVPGVADLDVWLAIGERPNRSPWISVGRAGKVVLKTAQMRLYVEAKVGALGLLRTSGASLVTLPILIEAAPAEARLQAVDCAGGSATAQARTGVAVARIGEIDTARLNDFKSNLNVRAANLVDIGLLKITGQADARAGQTDWKTLAFSRGDIAADRSKSVAVDNLARSTVSTLLGGLEVDVKLLGLGLGLSKTGLTSALASTLAPVAAPLDRVLNDLTQLLGVRLGEADVKVEGLACGGAALVG